MAWILGSYHLSLSNILSRIGDVGNLANTALTNAKDGNSIDITVTNIIEIKRKCLLNKHIRIAGIIKLEWNRAGIKYIQDLNLPVFIMSLYSNIINKPIAI
jgi:hypothetical protein